MVKIERKETEKTKAAVASLEKAKKQKGSYNTQEVNDALYEIFHGKCYLCENKETFSYQIEHLKPHQGDIDLKYDWNNLFWSCTHCNNTKLNKYDPILDCTKENVDECIAFRKRGYFGIEERLEFEMLDERIETRNTAELLKNVYYGETPQKKIEAKIIRKKLREELSEFKNKVREYKEAEGEDKEDLEIYLKHQLKNSSSFTAFKRWLIKDNKDYYKELLKYIG